MIRRKLMLLSVALMLVLIGAAEASHVSAATSQGGTDGPLYAICENAWMYNYPFGNHIATVHAGHRFREHGYTYDSWGRRWSYGHSGENPSQDGYILSTKLSPWSPYC